MSLQDRTIDGVTGQGTAGNPQSRAEDAIEVPAVPSPTEPEPEPDFEAD